MCFRAEKKVNAELLLFCSVTNVKMLLLFCGKWKERKRGLEGGAEGYEKVEKGVKWEREITFYGVKKLQGAR